MLEPDYDPVRNTGSNPALNTLRLSEIQARRLLTIDRQQTSYTVPTVEQMLRHAIANEAQSLIFLEVKDFAALIPTARVVNQLAQTLDETLLQRVVLKFSMQAFPTFSGWQDALRQAGLSTAIMANPIMSGPTATAINQLAPLPAPSTGGPYVSNAERAVASWALASNQLVPNVEIVIKDSTDFFRTTPYQSPQGTFDRPTSLTRDNAIRGTMADMVAIVRQTNTPLGALVPVPDYILWRQLPVTGFTVPNTFGARGQIDVTTAFFNNNSTCCYRLSDRLQSPPTSHEQSDIRDNVDWNRSIGVNVITTDDSDSVDSYYASTGELDRGARPTSKAPSADMNSPLSWALGFVPEPTTKVNILAWGGASASVWGGQVCLWDMPQTGYGWTYQCGNGNARREGYSDALVTQVVRDPAEVPGADDLIQIMNGDQTQCLIAGTEVFWSRDCTQASSLLRMGPNGTLQNVAGQYLTFWRYGVYYGWNYGRTSLTSSPDDWAAWRLRAA